MTRNKASFVGKRGWLMLLAMCIGVLPGEELLTTADHQTTIVGIDTLS